MDARVKRPQAAQEGRPGRCGAWRLGPRGLALPALLALLLALHSTAARPAAAQALTLSRNAFVDLAERPEAELPATGTVTVRQERWRVAGVERLRIVSPDPQVAAVLRYRPLAPAAAPATAASPEAASAPETPAAPAAGAEATAAPAGPTAETPAAASHEATAAPGAPGAPVEGGGWVLTVLLVAEPASPRYQVESDGQLLREGALVHQPRFALGERGLESGLAGAAGRVREIVLQDDGDAELRLRRAGDALELEVVPLAAGGRPSGGRPPAYLGQPLRFTAAGLLGFGWTDNALGELWLGSRLAGKFDAFLPALGGAQLGRLVATGQLWRSRSLALWLEGGAAAYRLVATSGVATQAVRPTGGVTLHWREGNWGAALHYGNAIDVSVLSAFVAWQGWSRLGLLAGWHSLEGRSGFGLGASLRF